jgi:hypothetical protein
VALTKLEEIGVAATLRSYERFPTALRQRVNAIVRLLVRHFRTKKEHHRACRQSPVACHVPAKGLVKMAYVLRSGPRDNYRRRDDVDKILRAQAC